MVVFWGEKIQLLNWKYVFLPKRVHKLQKVSLFNYALNFWAILFPPFKWIVWLIIKWAFCAHFRNFKVQTNDWKLLDMIAIRERTKRKRKKEFRVCICAHSGPLWILHNLDSLAFIVWTLCPSWKKDRYEYFAPKTRAEKNNF